MVLEAQAIVHHFRAASASIGSAASPARRIWNASHLHAGGSLSGQADRAGRIADLGSGNGAPRQSGSPFIDGVLALARQM
ncbi:hypothetical protein, partial [Paracoccus alkanivorans]|uniref:hypothetical protein n=1 Tax=Paracoccus alkanivorans TaxID=2116655 RepID=UPI001AA01A7A